MNTDNTQDGAEPSLASVGSRPVAWAVCTPGNWGEETPCFFCEQQARDHASTITGMKNIVTLYRQPRPTLTGAERTCLGYAIRKMDAEYAAGPAGVLRELLERLG